MAYPTAMLPQDVGVFANPKSIGELAEPLRSRIYTAMAACPYVGELALVSGLRSPWQQYLLRTARCPGMEFNTACRGNPVTALPYRSKHQRGLAADMGGTRRAMDWLRANARRFGLALTVPSEDWHFEAVVTPTAPITPWPGSVTPASPPPPTATP